MDLSFESSGWWKRCIIICSPMRGPRYHVWYRWLYLIFKSLNGHLAIIHGNFNAQLNLILLHKQCLFYYRFPNLRWLAYLNETDALRLLSMNQAGHINFSDLHTSI